AVTAEPVAAPDHVRVVRTRLLDLLQLGARISRTGEVHLVCPLCQLVHALQVIRAEGDDGQLQLALTEKGGVVALKGLEDEVPLLRLAIHHATLLALFADGDLALGTRGNGTSLGGVDDRHLRESAPDLLSFETLVIDERERVDTDAQTLRDPRDRLAL